MLLGDCYGPDFARPLPPTLTFSNHTGRVNGNNNVYILSAKIRRSSGSKSAVLRPDQLNMAVFIWYFVKSDLSSVGCYTRVHWTSYFFTIGTINKRPCITGHPANPLKPTKKKNCLSTQSTLGGVVHCFVGGEPRPTVSWVTKEGAPLPPAPQLYREYSNGTLQFFRYTFFIITAELPIFFRKPLNVYI